MIALHPVPAVVLASARARRLKVDLLPGVLPDVAGPQVAGLAVERVPPGVTQAVRPDLRPGAGAPDERIVLRHEIRAVRRDRAVGLPRLDPQHLAEQRPERLPVPHGVAAAAAIPEPDVQVAVGS